MDAIKRVQWPLMDELLHLYSEVHPLHIIIMWLKCETNVIGCQFSSVLNLYYNNPKVCVSVSLREKRMWLVDIVSARPLRVCQYSNTTWLLQMPAQDTVIKVNGPRTWNSLPAALRSPDLSLCSFKRQYEDLPVPSLRVSGSRTTVRRHCDCIANLAPIINRHTYLPT